MDKIFLPVLSAHKTYESRVFNYQNVLSCGTSHVPRLFCVSRPLLSRRNHLPHAPLKEETGPDGPRPVLRAAAVPRGAPTQYLVLIWVGSRYMASSFRLIHPEEKGSRNFLS